MEGSNEGIVSGNKEEVSIVVSWLSGSDVEVAITHLREAEDRLDKAKSEVSALKKKLAKALYN